MPVPSGEASLSDIQTEFGGSSPTSLSEYYSAVSGVPSSGEISISDFQGKSASSTITANTNYLQINASSYISSGGTLTIPSSVWIWSDSTSVPALNVDVANATIINNGKIIGKGGAGGTNGAGAAGGPAIKISASGVQIQNNSGAYIAGGGGGGGAGATYSLGGQMRSGGGGGAGGGSGGNGLFQGNTWSSGGAGGGINQSGSNANYSPDNRSNPAGKGGGSGGGGGAGDDGGNYDVQGYGGGGGGRILSGTGGTGGHATSDSNTVRTYNVGGAGGSANASGGNGGNGYGSADGAGGGGGWGASGGTGYGSGFAGGAGGKAIQIASGSSGYTNSGTIYGSNAATLQYPYVSGTHYVSNGSASSSLNSNFGTYTLHKTVWDYQESGYIWTFTVASNATGSLRFRSTADPDAAPRSNSGNDRILRLYKNGSQVASTSAPANQNATLDKTYSTTGGDVWKMYMDNSIDWRDLGGFERITNIYITGA